MTLTEARPVGVLTVANDRDVSAGYDIEAFGWEQEPDGTVLLPPTGDIRVEPTALTVSPRSSAQIRVIALTPAPPPGAAEKVYRIRISERGDREREETEQDVQMIASFTLPVFQKPEVTAHKGRLVVGAVDDGKLGFAVHNDGTEHTYIGQAVVRGEDATGREVFRIQRQGWYVLPGGLLTFRAALSGEDCRESARLVVEAHALKSDDMWTGTVTPDRARCGDGKVSEFPIPGLFKIVDGDIPDGTVSPTPPKE